METKRHALTDGNERVLQLQGERGQRDFLRHGQHGHGGQVGGRIACVPLTAWSVQRQTTGWETTGAKSQTKKLLQSIDTRETVFN